jgi:antibiotic biosynthesis monooxygenase (ABM) superfamily enzyme
MAQKRPKITFEAQLLKVGTEWRIIATYPNGLKEHITGFENETEIEEWLASERRQAWLSRRDAE